MIKLLYAIFLLGIISFYGCNKDHGLAIKPNPIHKNIFKLEFINSYILTGVKEPSGLSWAMDKKNLIVVDDNSNKAFLINTEGKILKTLAYTGDDTEGITINNHDKTIWISEEALSQLIQLDSNGNKINTYPINIVRESKKKGLEGLGYSNKEDIYYILNEAKPRLLIKWKPSQGIIQKTTLNFSLDCSGIYANTMDKSLWIVSDESQKLYYCNNQGAVIQSFDLAFPKAEGIVVDINKQRVYIVSDSEQKLYTYKITTL